MPKRTRSMTRSRSMARSRTRTRSRSRSRSRSMRGGMYGSLAPLRWGVFNANPSPLPSMHAPISDRVD